MENGNKFDKSVEEYLGFMKNEYAAAAISLFLILYAAVIAPKLPPHILQWFDNWIVQIALFFAIVYVSNKNVTVALITAVAVLVTIMIVNNQITLRKITEEQEMEGFCSVCGPDSCDCGDDLGHPDYHDNPELDDDDKLRPNVRASTHSVGRPKGRKLPDNIMTFDDNINGIMDSHVEQSYTEIAGAEHAVSGCAQTSLGGPKMDLDDEPEYPSHKDHEGEVRDSVQNVINETQKVSGVYQHDIDADDVNGCSLDDSGSLGSDQASVDHVDSLNN